MAVAGVFRRFQVAVEAIHAGALMGVALKLYGCMADMIPLVEHGGERLQDR